MFKDFEFFSHTYSADFENLPPIIKIPNSQLISTLSREFEKSQTFRRYESVIFQIDKEKVKVDLTHRF